MSIDLTTKFLPYVDEMFSAESKKSLITNQDFTWDGAHSVKVYKVGTTAMNDYGRSGPDEGNWSRYGPVQGLDATTETMTLTKDRSFTFALDRLDQDETQMQLAAASALARQQREVVIPEVDAYVYGVMCANAGTKPEAKALTSENIYSEIIAAGAVMDEALVPETERCLIVTPAVYLLLKLCTDISKNSDIGTELRLRGVVGILDGMNVIKVPAARVPANFGFMICHPCACVAPVKLESYKAHEDPPGISGSLVEGRIVYDAFVLGNKVKAIYYQALPQELTGLTIGNLTLTPTFATATTSYTATTTAATNKITATVSNGGTATVKVNGTAIENGSSATWAAGSNTVKVIVGETEYTVTVTKS